MFIQFVRNSAQPQFIPNLLKFAELSEFPLVHHLAITTLGVYDVEHLGLEVKKAMNRIYHQNVRKYEGTVRSAAVNLILTSQPSKRDVENIFISLSYLKSRELANFILARIRDLIKTDHPSSNVLMEVLKDTAYSNYWSLAQSGMASAYTGYLHKKADSSGTYGLFMEYSNAGMMRRTAVDFSLHSQNSSISLTQLGIVA
uniref:MTP large subunit lipid-binding domain-containing protein n=1 Tax=Ciona savignyi TaxID=51511 RepID=H2YTN7_CIOSA